MNSKEIKQRITEAEDRLKQLNIQLERLQGEITLAERELEAWRVVFPIEQQREVRNPQTITPFYAVTGILDKIPEQDSQLDALVIALEQHQETTFDVLKKEVKQLYGSVDNRKFGIHINVLEKAGRVTKNGDVITVIGSLKPPYRRL